MDLLKSTLPLGALLRTGTPWLPTPVPGLPVTGRGPPGPACGGELLPSALAKLWTDTRRLGTGGHVAVPDARLGGHGKSLGVGGRRWLRWGRRAPQPGETARTPAAGEWTPAGSMAPRSVGAESPREPPASPTGSLWIYSPTLFKGAEHKPATQGHRDKIRAFKGACGPALVPTPQACAPAPGAGGSRRSGGFPAPSQPRRAAVLGSRRPGGGAGPGTPAPPPAVATAAPASV